MAESIATTALDESNLIRIVLNYLGWPVVALGIAVWLAYRNIAPTADRTKSLNDWVENGLKVSAMILVVTGLGGSLSSILRATPAVTIIAQYFRDSGLPAILLPFVLGVAGNMITGSSTVGVITSASLTAPMLDSLALSPEAAMLSGGCGSVIFKYVNSSFFWVCTSLSKLNVGDAIWCYGGASFVAGLVSFLSVYAMWCWRLI
jgi:GntP family gluconate:H+ symporter